MVDTESTEKPLIRKPTLLLLSVFVVATCGLIYELVAGTLASYVLGDSVMQFSTIIGLYLFSMGVGSYLSRYFSSGLLTWFIRIEIMIAIIGGFSPTALFILFEQVYYFRFVLYSLVFLTGMLVGLEIPLLMRILEKEYSFTNLVSEIFTFDYIGALLASLVFPLFFVPHLGLIRTALFFGLLNVGIALWMCIIFEKEHTTVKGLKGICIFVIATLVIAFALANKIQDYTEQMSYHEKVIYSKTSSYQRVVLTKHKSDVRLYLNGNLQFSSADEYRYHEALVHPVLSAVAKKDTVVILGGGDGLAAREVLKYPEVKKIYLIDLDPAVTQLFKQHPLLTPLNKGALNNSKLEVLNMDAFVWLSSQKNKQFDAFIIDFPDPSNYAIGKLYSTTFYKQLHSHLNENGLAVIQSTSPYVAPKSFWCVKETLSNTGFKTLPYHTFVPSFGDWGYIMAYKSTTPVIKELPDNLRFFTKDAFSNMTFFTKDMYAQGIAINRLNNQALVHYFEEEWAKLEN